MDFQKTSIPVVTYGTNPYIDIVKELAADENSEAIQFLHTVADHRKDFDKIKRELQAAGSIAGVTVRSHIYDAGSGRKLVLPSVKDAVLKLTGSGKETVEKITVYRVVFWVTDKIVHGEASDSEDGE